MTPCNDGSMAHHYVLEEARGQDRISGTCKKCGHTRDWRPSLDIDNENAQWTTGRLKHLFVQYDPDRRDTRIL